MFNFKTQIMKNLVKSILVISAVIFLFSSCNSDDKEEQTSVKVVLTDGPFPFNFVTKANVEVAKIELKTQNGEYVTVFEGSGSYNMVELTNGVTADVETTTLEPGTYSKARISFNSANVHLSNGSTFDAQVDGQAEVISIEPALVVEEGETSEVLLDLDLGSSFGFKGFGNSTLFGWIFSADMILGCEFHPHFRACDFNQTGKISGSVKVEGDLFEGADVSVEIDGETVHTHSKADGTFKFIGVKDGTYTVSVNTQSSGSGSIEAVTVNGNATTSCSIEIN